MHSGGFASASALLNAGEGKEGGRERRGGAAVRGAEKEKTEAGGPPVESRSGGRQGGTAAGREGDDRCGVRDVHSIIAVD